MARILIVEDEFLIALVASDALAEAGHEIVGMATNFDGGYEAVLRQKPDLALLDVRIASQRDGIDLALVLRQEFDIPAIFTTGSRDDANVRRAEPARPAAWILKPYTEEHLVDAVSAALTGEVQLPLWQPKRPDQAL